MDETHMKTLNFYNLNSYPLSESYESAEVESMQRTLESCFEKRSRLLELGFGSGRDASYMQARGFDVTGIDGSSRMVDEAVKLHLELEGRLFQGILPDALESRDLLPGSFDGIYAVAVLMHLKPGELASVFSSVHRLLVPTGRFLFSVPLERDDVDEKGLDGKGRFFLSWSREEWSALARNSGFRELKGSVTEDGLGRSGVRWLTLVLEAV